MNKTPVIIEAIGYLLFRLKQADKIKLVKLMFLADKYHAMNYGRTISDDAFLAFPHGPGGSRTMDILEYDPLVIGKHIKLARGIFKQGKGHSYFAGVTCNPKSFTMLSESDFEALDFVINNFGPMNTWDLVDYTHKLKEWKRFKSLFLSGQKKPEPIKSEDLLWPVQDKFFSVEQEHLKESLYSMTKSPC